MDRPLDLPAVRAVSAFAGRIIRAVNFRHPAVFVLCIAVAGYEISLHQAYFIPREHTEIFPGRFFHKILPVNIKFPAKRHRVGSKFFIFHVVDDRKLL